MDLCPRKEKEAFEEPVKRLFIIKPQRDFMIIFITSSFKILGAMKVNNLCLLKLPFKEQRALQALSNSESPQSREAGKGWGRSRHQQSSPGNMKALIAPTEGLSGF